MNIDVHAHHFPARLHRPRAAARRPSQPERQHHARRPPAARRARRPAHRGWASMSRCSPSRSTSRTWSARRMPSRPPGWPTTSTPMCAAPIRAGSRHSWPCPCRTSTRHWPRRSAAWDTLGMRGVALGCSIARRPLDDPSFEPFWAELDRRGTVAFLHPVGPRRPGGRGSLRPHLDDRRPRRGHRGGRCGWSCRG